MRSLHEVCETTMPVNKDEAMFTSWWAAQVEPPPPSFLEM